MSTPGIVAFDEGFRAEGAERKAAEEHDADRKKQEARDAEALADREAARARKKVTDSREDTRWERDEKNYQRQLQISLDEEAQQEIKKKVSNATRSFALTNGALTQPLIDVYNESMPDGFSITRMVRGKDGNYKVDMVGPDGSKTSNTLTYDQIGMMAMSLNEPDAYFRELHKDNHERTKALDDARRKRTGRDEVYSSTFRSYVSVDELRKEYRKARADRDADLAKLQQENPTAYTAESKKAFPTFDDWAANDYGVTFEAPEGSAIPDGGAGAATAGAKPGAKPAPGGDGKSEINVYQALTMLGKTPGSVKGDPKAFEAHIRKMFGKKMSPADLDVLIQKAMNPKGTGTADGGAPPVPMPGQGAAAGQQPPAQGMMDQDGAFMDMGGRVAARPTRTSFSAEGDATMPGAIDAPLRNIGQVPPELEEKRATLERNIRELTSLVGDGSARGKIESKKARRERRVDDKSVAQLKTALKQAQAEYDGVMAEVTRIQSGVP
jgi:hypothetical protein